MIQFDTRVVSMIQFQRLCRYVGDIRVPLHKTFEPWCGNGETFAAGQVENDFSTLSENVKF